MCQDCSQVSFDIVQMVDQRECYLIWCVGVAGWHPILRSPPQNRHTNVLLPLYSIIRPMCLGPQRKQAFLYMTRMSLIFMEVNKCTRMEGVFHSRRLTMGPLCSLILQLLYLNIPTIYYTVWMNIVFSGQNIYLRRLCEIFSGHWKQGRFTLYPIFVSHSALIAHPFSRFLKDNIAGFFSRKLHFVQRLWQIAAAAQNGLVRYELCQVRAV